MRAAFTVALVLAFGALAFVLRVALVHRQVFGQDLVVFLETDAWYHMRLVDSLVQNFPNRVWFDPYLLHPGGKTTQVAPLLGWLISGIALVLGAGAPSARLIDVVGAYVPPVIGSLIAVPMYFLGRELFSRRVGLCAAAIIGLLPGQVLLVTLLGFPDHHCLEVLLSAVTLVFLVFALKPGLSSRKQTIHALVSGVALWCYLLAWSNGTLLIVILLAWALGYLLLAPPQHPDASAIFRTLAIAFAIAAVLVFPWTTTTRSFTMETVALAAALVSTTLLWTLGRIVRHRLWYRAAALTVCAAVLLGATMSGDVAGFALEQIEAMSPTKVQPIVEATPLLQSHEAHPLWKQFTTSIYLAVIALALLVPGFLKRPTPANMLFLTWTAGTVAATFGQIRFAYYLALAVALLAAVACDRFLGWMARVNPKTGKRGRSDTESRPSWPVYLRVIAGVGVLALVIVTPSVPYFRQFATSSAISPEQLDAFAWMRSNTPDPFGDPRAYYRVFEKSAGRRFPVMPSYGVLGTWSDGYSMIRVARRVPNANPSQAGAFDVSVFLLAEEENEANEVLERLNTRYVVTDWLMIERTLAERSAPSHFSSIVLTAGRDRRYYYESFYRRVSDRLEPVVLYYPSYYRTMASRLHSFAAAAVMPRRSTWVISFVERPYQGRLIKEIQTERPFSAYDDAVAFVASTKSDRYRIVGRDPWVSCVPLPALTEYVPVYRSWGREAGGDRLGPNLVRIFEYRRWTPWID